MGGKPNKGTRRDRRLKENRRRASNVARLIRRRRG